MIHRTLFLVGVLVTSTAVMISQADESTQAQSKPVLWEPPIVGGIHGPLLGVNWRGFIQVDGADFSNDSSGEFKDDAVIRRARLTFGRGLDKHWNFKGSAELSNGDVEIKDLYVRYDGLSFASLTVGNHQAPFSLEQMTSSRFTTLLEKALPVDALAPSKSVGVSLKSARNNLTLAGGLFASGWEQDGLRTSGDSIATRIAKSFQRNGNEILHFGMSASYRYFSSALPRARARPESGVSDIRMVDTGEIDNSRDITQLGIETAIVRGPISLQAEYLSASLSRGAGLAGLHFDGWYLYGSWLLSGETRPFLKKKGTFGRIDPYSPYRFTHGGHGAWEVSARLSQVNLNDEDIIGGKEKNLSLGLNWYARQYVKIMANYVKVLQLERPGSIYDGNEMQIFELRLQLEF